MTELEAIELELINRELKNRQQPQQEVLPLQITQNPDVQLMGEWLKNMPFGKRIASLASGQPLENIERTLSAIPEPQSKTFGMAAGRALPDIAMATPFMRGAGLIPKIPAFAKTALGLGTYAGVKAAAQKKPILPSALGGAASGIGFHGASRLGASLIPSVIPGAERIGSALGGYATGKILNLREDKEALFYGAMGGIFPSKKIQGSEGATKIAERVIKYALKPKKSLYNFGKNPERAIAQEGLWGVNFNSIDKKAEIRLSELNQSKDRMRFEAQNMGKKVNIVKNKALEPIYDLKVELEKAPESHSATIKLLDNYIVDITKRFPNLDKLTIDQAYELRDIINSLKPSGIFANQSEVMTNKALHETYHNIVEAINNSGISSDLKTVNKRISNLIAAREAINDATNRNPSIFRFIPLGMWGAAIWSRNPLLAGVAIGEETMRHPLGASLISKVMSKKYPKVK